MGDDSGSCGIHEAFAAGARCATHRSGSANGVGASMVIRGSHVLRAPCMSPRCTGQTTSRRVPTTSRNGRLRRRICPTPVVPECLSGVNPRSVSRSGAERTACAATACFGGLGDVCSAEHPFVSVPSAEPTASAGPAPRGTSGPIRPQKTMLVSISPRCAGDDTVADRRDHHDAGNRAAPGCGAYVGRGSSYRTKITTYLHQSCCAILGLNRWSRRRGRRGPVRRSTRRPVGRRPRHGTAMPACARGATPARQRIPRMHWHTGKQRHPEDLVAGPQPPGLRRRFDHTADIPAEDERWLAQEPQPPGARPRL